jgi:hypothetical protein
MTAIALCGVSDPAAVRAIAAIARFWDISLDIRADAEGSVADGIIFGDGSWQGRLPALVEGRPFLAFAGSGAGDAADSGVPVTFASSPAIPETLRGRTLFAIEPTFSAALQPAASLDDGARVNGRPIWKISTNRHGTSLIAATPPPLLPEERRLPEIFNGETFLHVLPVWLFFRGLAERNAWRPPPLRACMVVDDPNLHRSSYGSLDYRKILEFARSRPFHLAVAMVPLDGWWFSSSAARLFRENPGVFSLQVHGNNHLAGEMALPWSESERRSLVSQSLRRTAAFENKTKLRVDRVMVPPHGVCSREMIDSLWDAGYEGMNSIRWSLWKHAPAATLPPDAFLRPAAMLGRGLPVISRFRFKSPICRNEIHVAALLGQPIIPYGHHPDFSQGMADVQAAVDEINALGPVQWLSMRKILETNFEQRTIRDTLQIRLYSRRVQGAMPTGAARLQVEFSDSFAEGDSALGISWGTGEASHRSVGRPGEPISLPSGCRFQVCLAAGSPPEAAAPPFPLHPMVLARRLASEARDRLSPLAKRLGYLLCRTRKNP